MYGDQYSRYIVAQIGWVTTRQHNLPVESDTSQNRDPTRPADITAYEPPSRSVMVTKTLESRTWSGAIVSPQPLQSPHRYGNQPPEHGEFYYITSTWIIPDASPSPKGDTQGNYACCICIGFDGWDPDQPMPLLNLEHHPLCRMVRNRSTLLSGTIMSVTALKSSTNTMRL